MRKEDTLTKMLLATVSWMEETFWHWNITRGRLASHTSLRKMETLSAKSSDIATEPQRYLQLWFFPKCLTVIKRDDSEITATGASATLCGTIPVGVVTHYKHSLCFLFPRQGWYCCVDFRQGNHYLDKLRSRSQIIWGPTTNSTLEATLFHSLSHGFP